ncbi:hypothetical protein OXPF_27980 [Oxobacter pfennigii]|uniref:Aerotolerance regulator N-terminal domain-containing protein n=1 Tax=Oxobacter pfennigii TaxID=36849 RepID=A0A0P8W443_9CLOT|nr:VWA domain-containing protein [Oxobacter pfennigii]KPU43357.1 hypothetical protein OXPF_27980 [Oxobacter pfennigii]
MFFLKPLRLLALLGLIFIVLIHLKRRKPKEMEVSSIKLWERVFADISNVKKKRINKYLLLILQLLIGSLIIFSFSEPYLLSKNKDNIYTLAFDCSMSMNAVEKGESRMNTAVKKAGEFIDSTPSGSRFNILSMEESAKVLKENLGKSEAKAAIGQLKPSNNPLDAEKSSKVLNSFGENVVVFTDKDVFKNKNVIKLGETLRDLGIVYGSFEAGLESSYCIVKNYGDSQVNADVALKDEKGNRLGLNDVTLKGGEEKKVFFYDLPQGIQYINFSLENEDMLLENNYYPVEALAEKKKVLLLGESYYVEKAISILPYVELIKKDKVDFSKEEFDFYIIAGDETEGVPKDKALWWVKEVNIGSGIPVVEGEISFEDDKFSYGLNNIKAQGRGYETAGDEETSALIKIDGKTLMYMDKNRHIYSTVDWDNSPLVFTPAFPIFIDNLLGYYLKEDANYKYRDFVINNEQDEGISGTYNVFSNISIKNVLILAVIILLILEWRVFKLGY